MLSYAQWASESLYAETPAPPPSSTEVQHPFRLYRSHHSSSSVSPDTPPGARCIVIVSIEFDGPDQQRLRQWTDGVLDALDAEPEPIPGLIAAHFHTSTEGTQVLNYAGWTGEQAHRAALEGGPDGIAQTDLPEWRRVLDFPGTRRNTVMRYVLHRALHAQTAPG